jgi:hypothetical protein
MDDVSAAVLRCCAALSMLSSTSWRRWGRRRLTRTCESLGWVSLT